MKLITVRHFLEYAVLIVPVKIIQMLPHKGVRISARLIGAGLHAIPSMRRLVLANIATALPELPEARRRHIARESFRHMTLNMMEFLWMEGNAARIRRCCPELTKQVYDCLTMHHNRGERMILVNPHMGSWECSGLVVPFYAGIPMSAVAKPLRNPFLNKLYNRWRKDTRGVKVIFSNGAVRASIAALKAGDSIGILVDQNTKLRDGGEFVNFFGLPVACSTAPAMMTRYCTAHGVPVQIIFGATIRVGEDEHLATFCRPISKPIGEYTSDREVIEELTGFTEEAIRKYPEQYLWLYKRFQYIPEGTPEEVRKRYPYYAKTPGPRFYHRNRKAGAAAPPDPAAE